MIPQADLDRALAKWKGRPGGQQQEPPTPGPADLAVTQEGEAAPAAAAADGSSAAINLADFEDPDAR
jgi:hypothetical protein